MVSLDDSTLSSCSSLAKSTASSVSAETDSSSISPCSTWRDWVHRRNGFHGFFSVDLFWFVLRFAYILVFVSANPNYDTKEAMFSFLFGSCV